MRSQVFRRLLLIACSNRKVRTRGLLPAIERYDGVAYRVIRKARREGYFPPNVDIKILSAKYGLIDAEARIVYYDKRMDKQRAVQLRPSVHEELKKCFTQKQYSEIYVDLGKDYLPAIEGFVMPQDSKLVWADGRIGERLSKMKVWLSGSVGRE